MTQQQHPIAPPLELVQQWINEADGGHDPRWQDYEQDIANRAAQWGADQELEACCEWLILNGYGTAISRLRAARRPKPPSLKKQALIHFESFAATFETCGVDSDLIRRALEALPE